jgi:parvulin-like peptidyl-prolyl isomerase
MHRKTKAKSGRKELLIICIIIAAAIVLAFIFYSMLSKTKVNALAEVNGVKILQDDLDEIALTIPPQLRGNVSYSDLLEQAINYEIVRQEAEKLGITITDEEVDANINESLKKAGLTMDVLKDSTRQQNIRWETLFNAYKKQLLSYKFLNETILKNMTVTEDEMKDFYSAYSKELNVSYDEIREEINKTVAAMKGQQALGILLKQKRAGYEIMRYVDGS